MENEKNLNEPNLEENKEPTKATTTKDKTEEGKNPNLRYYEIGKEVPPEAKKEIQGGKLKGFTDINPMWRIKKLTEMFGPCGIGWKAPIVDKWTEPGAKGEIIANVKINLFYYDKESKQWAEPIEGCGGSMLITTEKGALTSNDEAFKMAYTDALSVTCKMLGIGADVYFDKDRTKYDLEPDGTTPKQKPTTAQKDKDNKSNKSKYQIVKDLINGTSITFDDVKSWLVKKVGTDRVNSVDDKVFEELIKAIKAKTEKKKQEDDQTPWDE